MTRATPFRARDAEKGRCGRQRGKVSGLRWNRQNPGAFTTLHDRHNAQRKNSEQCTESNLPRPRSRTLQPLHLAALGSTSSRLRPRPRLRQEQQVGLPRPAGGLV
jgi:hypothetical protein